MAVIGAGAAYGVNPSSALVSKTEFERENGQYVYEVEFAANGVAYDYTIKATDGAVIAKNTEGQLTGTIQQTDPVTALPVVDSPVVVITAERAKEIALQHASLAATNVTFVHAELDYDDGVQVYDVESYQGNTEYDYEIDAATGTILSCNYDAEAHQPAAQQNDPAATPSSTVQTPIAPNNAAYIGVDCAKNIAVSHAGIALADAAFQKAKLENDDGRAEYEIEFYKDGIEYEYTIDAVSGTVLEYYVERDD